MNVTICDNSAQDSALICDLLREHFDINGFIGELYAFDSGEALAEAFVAKSFDVVFLDIYMDGMNGLKTTERLRALDPGFSLVFITSITDHAMDCFSPGTDGYVVNPIQQDAYADFLSDRLFEVSS